MSFTKAAERFAGEKARESWNKTKKRKTEKQKNLSYTRKLNAQGGVCAICRRPPGKKRLARDHNHATGKNRLLLCSRCNPALGLFDDSPRRLLHAIRYLEKQGFAGEALPGAVFCMDRGNLMSDEGEEDWWLQ